MVFPDIRSDSALFRSMPASDMVSSVLFRILFSRVSAILIPIFDVEMTLFSIVHPLTPDRDRSAAPPITPRIVSPATVDPSAERENTGVL
ncbi:hypothetical protein DSECCO2_633410 [anaerobic digester metagenome]